MAIANKRDALEAAIKIAQEAAHGGHTSPEYVLEETYKVIDKIYPTTF